MNSIDEMIAVLQAAKAGKKIQFRYRHGGMVWNDVSETQWNFYEHEYRVKPEPREFWVSFYADTSQGRLWRSRQACQEAQEIARGGAEIIHVREVLE